MSGYYRFFAAISTALALAACSAANSPPLAIGHATASGASSPSGAAVYAFSPGEALIASYSASARGRAKPSSLLEGARTQLSTGNGMAIDQDGTTYVVVYGASSNGPLKLLVFAPSAHGDAAPQRTALLRGPVVPGHANGLALDGHGNFWVAAIGKLLRFPIDAKGRVRPNASIAVRLDTPDGYMPASASNVALDAAGNVYCSCSVVYHGAQAKGVSEYELGSGNATLIRSFFDINLPEVPPTSIAIDGSGTIYLASPIPNSGVFAYDPGTGSGSVASSRRFVGGRAKTIASIATDAVGNVYVASGSRVVVFGPRSNGHVRPLRTMVDPKHLQYGTSTYGTLVNVR